MKKNKKQKELRLFHKRWRKELKRRRIKKIRRIKRNTQNNTRAQKLFKNIQKGKKSVFVAEPNLSIVHNPIDTINFFAKIMNSISSCIPTYIDVSNVNMITIDALLYLLAIIDKMKFEQIPIHIQGNLPKDPVANEIFAKSGFLKYVKSRSPSIASSDDCVQIYDGSNADSQIAKKLCLFAMDKLNVDRNSTKGLFVIVMEIVSNTKHHAYSASANLPKWYAYAWYNKNSREISFAIMDTGLGIPNTIRKNWAEKMSELLRMKSQDSALLKSVLKGDFRTQTKEKYRGKGIPEIQSYSANKYITDLTIVSNTGYVSIDNNKEIEFTTPLCGTLFSWRMNNGN
ncbi:MAG: hypothetical protein HW406_1751 [Candidatus Brocadiaceae bacterium]|nr:hypothetical protein [Candidatus Brocadiaceae bacterium]